MHVIDLTSEESVSGPEVFQSPAATVKTDPEKLVD